MDDETDVRDVLAEIGTDSDVARLEARIDELEGELERAGTRAGEEERARRGALDLMRARIEDAIAAMEATADDQRQSWSQLESRLAEVVADVEGGASRLVSALREDLAPRVHRAAARADEVDAELRGELESVASDLQSRVGAVIEHLEELRDAVRSRTHEDGTRVDAIRRELEATLNDLRAELNVRTASLGERLESMTGLVAEQADEVARQAGVLDAHDEHMAGVGNQLHGLRGELETLRSEVEHTAEQVRTELAREVDERFSGAPLQDWERALREAAGRLEEATSSAQAAIERERAARNEADSALRTRLEELSARVEQVDGRTVSQTGRHLSELGQLHRHVEELAGRVEVVTRRVNDAVEGVSGELANRVGAIAAELESVRESGLRQGERLSATDRLLRRLAELETRQEELGRRISQGNGSGNGGADPALGRLQRDLAGVVDRLSDLEQRGGMVADRLEEVEAVARAAGKAIAAAIRRSRESTPAP